MALGDVTDPRFIARTIIGIDWQGTEGEAVPGAPYTPAQFIVAKNFSMNPDPTYLDPDGTHGSHFERFQGRRIISQAFKLDLEMWGSKYQIMPFVESVLSGQPTVATGDNVRSGAGASDITAFSLIGARPHHNVEGFDFSPALVPAVTIEMVDTPSFPVTVNVYSDAAKTKLVATASVAAAATPTALVASGTSGLTGSITLGTASTADALAVITKIIYSFANQYTRFFRVFYTDGDEANVFSDCVVNMLTFESEENGELAVTAEIMAKRRTVTPSSVFLPDESQLDVTPYSHSELTLTNDVGGTPITPAVDQFSMRVENNVLQYIANCPTPQKLIKRGFTGIRGSYRGESADETMGLVRQARSNTAVLVGFKPMRADYDLGTTKLRLDMQRVRPRLAEPGIEEELVGKTELEYDALYDGAVAPLSVEISP